MQFLAAELDGMLAIDLNCLKLVLTNGLISRSEDSACLNVGLADCQHSFMKAEAHITAGSIFCSTNAM